MRLDKELDELLTQDLIFIIENNCHHRITLDCWIITLNQLDRYEFISKENSKFVWTVIKEKDKRFKIVDTREKIDKRIEQLYKKIISPNNT